MTPILAGLLAEAEQKGLTLLIDSVTTVVKDVLDGKSVAAAFNDLAMSMAERQAVVLDDVVAPKK